MIDISNYITTLRFNCANRLDWLRDIAEMHAALKCGNITDAVFLRFDNYEIAKIKPIHVASLACLIEAMANPDREIHLHRQNDSVGEYLWTNLKFREYWAGGKNFVEASDHSIFNLWRLRNEEKEIIPIRVYNYFKQHYFLHKDLSSVKNSLDEAYYNVFDHADANGNAFSFIQYDEDRHILYIAVCDFGKGIPTTVRAFRPDITTDVDALQLAMQDQFTIKSQNHNSGMGLGNIMSACTEGDSLWIVSNNSSLVAQDGELRCFANDFYFPGTALFYNLSLSKFEDEEIIDKFELEL